MSLGVPRRRITTRVDKIQSSSISSRPKHAETSTAPTAVARPTGKRRQTDRQTESYSSFVHSPLAEWMEPPTASPPTNSTTLRLRSARNPSTALCFSRFLSVLAHSDDDMFLRGTAAAAAADCFCYSSRRKRRSKQRWSHPDAARMGERNRVSRHGEYSGSKHWRRRAQHHYEMIFADTITGKEGALVLNV